MEEIYQKVKVLDAHFKKVQKPDSVRLLERVVKLNEEVGELCEACLGEVDVNQRKKEEVLNFDEELADVLICALLLGHSRGINVESLINHKIDHIINNIHQ